MWQISHIYKIIRHFMTGTCKEYTFTFLQWLWAVMFRAFIIINQLLIKYQFSLHAKIISFHFWHSCERLSCYLDILSTKDSIIWVHCVFNLKEIYCIIYVFLSYDLLSNGDSITILDVKSRVLSTKDNILSFYP